MYLFLYSFFLECYRVYNLIIFENNALNYTLLHLMSFFLKTLSLLFGSLSSVNLLRMLSLFSSCYGIRSWVLGQFSLCIMCQLWLQDLSSSPAYILVHCCRMIPKAEFGSLPTLLQKAVIIRDNNVDFWYKKKLVISSLVQNTFWTKERVRFQRLPYYSVSVSCSFPSEIGVCFPSSV